MIAVQGTLFTPGVCIGHVAAWLRQTAVAARATPGAMKATARHIPHPLLTSAPPALLFNGRRSRAISPFLATFAHPLGPGPCTARARGRSGAAGGSPGDRIQRKQVHVPPAEP